MNNDLIKRIAVCDMLHDEMGAWGNCADEIDALLKANDALWKIPAVDAVEVVHGEWVLVEYQSSQFGVDQEYQCSICGTPTDEEFRTRYCPNCGAKMDGERRTDG